jgi:hypothetical protein
MHVQATQCCQNMAEKAVRVIKACLSRLCIDPGTLVMESAKAP